MITHVFSAIGFAAVILLVIAVSLTLAGKVRWTASVEKDDES